MSVAIMKELEAITSSVDQRVSKLLRFVVGQIEPASPSQVKTLLKRSEAKIVTIYEEAFGPTSEYAHLMKRAYMAAGAEGRDDIQAAVKASGAGIPVPKDAATILASAGSAFELAGKNLAPDAIAELRGVFTRAYLDGGSHKSLAADLIKGGFIPDLKVGNRVIKTKTRVEMMVRTETKRLMGKSQLDAAEGVEPDIDSRLWRWFSRLGPEVGDDSLRRHGKIMTEREWMTHDFGDGYYGFPPLRPNDQCSKSFYREAWLSDDQRETMKAPPGSEGRRVLNPNEAGRIKTIKAAKALKAKRRPVLGTKPPLEKPRPKPKPVPKGKTPDEFLDELDAESAKATSGKPRPPSRPNWVGKEVPDDAYLVTRKARPKEVFKPLKTKAAAEKWARENVATAVDLRGIPLTAMNEVLEALHEMIIKRGHPPLRELVTKTYKRGENYAAMMFSNGRMEVSRSYFKTKIGFFARNRLFELPKPTSAGDYVFKLDDIEKIRGKIGELAKLDGTAAQVKALEEQLEYYISIVGQSREVTGKSIREVIVHEYGHAVHYRQSMIKNAPGKIYYPPELERLLGGPDGKTWGRRAHGPGTEREAAKISRYATSNANEYIAEAYTAYHSGEASLVPQYMRDFIKELDEASRLLGKAFDPEDLQGGVYGFHW
jgi:hypothetical protein